MRDAPKSFYFHKKKSMHEKEFSFNLSDFRENASFYERIKVGNFYESQFRQCCNKHIVFSVQNHIE